MHLQRGRVNVSSSVKKMAYVSQQAWIMNQTVRNNILFGMEFKQHKYDRVLRVCELGSDLSILPAGDGTEIGEKGINLSGGQKQRLAVARACYSDADLFLFDDPLSAVDSHVAKKLFDNVFSSKSGLLRKKTRVLVTNSVSILPDVDKIFVLKSGKISESGSYNELMAKGGAFAEFLEEFSVKVSSGDEANGDINKQHQEDTNNISMRIRTDSSISNRSINGDTAVAWNRSASESVSIVNSGEEKEKLGKVNVLIEDEKRMIGRVKLSVFVTYFKHMSMLSVSIIAYILSQLFQAGGNYWLSQWSKDALETNNGTSSSDEDQNQKYMRLGVYAILGFLHTVFLLIGTLVLAKGAVDAATKLHKNLLYRIMRSPMSFFDTTPIGRIINRFSSDMDGIDIWLLDCMIFVFSAFLEIIAVVTMILVAIPIFSVVILPLAVIFFVVQRFYVSSSRQLRRLDSTTKSPVYSQFSETLSGATTIRAYGATERFIRESDVRIDKNEMCTLCSAVCNRWLSVRLQLVGNLSVFFCALFSVISKDTMDTGLTGLAIAYAMQMAGLLNWFVQVSSSFETQAVCVERVLEYSDNVEEADWNSDEDKKPAANWPQEGAIAFADYSTR